MLLLFTYATWTSRTGRHGQLNGDALELREAVTAEERRHLGTIWAIADGIGHDERAAQAARLAATTVIERYWQAGAAVDPLDRLQLAVSETNRLLYGQAGPDLPMTGAGAATLLVVAIVEARLFVAHVGRSRLYLLRQGELQQLTEDHTWVAQRVRAGQLTAEAAATHPNRNVIVRCLGVRPTVTIDTARHRLLVGDSLALCSDGLALQLDQRQIAAALREAGGAAAAQLADSVTLAGASDDVTVVTIGVVAAPVHDERRLGQLTLLSRLVGALTASLEPTTTLASVLEQMLVVTGGERAAIALVDADGRLEPTVARDRRGRPSGVGFSRSIAEGVLLERRPRLITSILDDEALSATASLVDQAVRSAMCVPLTVSGETIGILYVDASTTVRFDDNDLNLLTIFASQAAAALRNAQLHAALRSQAAAAQLSAARQSALVRSLGDALIAIDRARLVTDWNPAAEALLGVAASWAIGQPLLRLVPGPLAVWLMQLTTQAEAVDRTLLFGDRWQGRLTGEQPLVLEGRVAVVREAGEAIGFVFLLRDETETVRLAEAHAAESAERARLRDLLGRYLAPTLLEQLLARPGQVRLGGARLEITVLFADIRGFTGTTESQTPETVLAMLNQFLALATAEIFAELGTLDKFLGDGVMALFGAPLAMPDHAWRAVRAAQAMCDRMVALRRESGLSVGFGIGINTGEALVGNIGTPQLMAYTAIGDTVNVAARLQSEARTGEILISEATLAHLDRTIAVEALGSIYVKGRSAPVLTYKLAPTARPPAAPT